jgi:Flp pilus assembly pilin Flp
MIRKLKAFLKDESGATAIEYGLIATRPFQLAASLFRC